MFSNLYSFHILMKLEIFSTDFRKMLKFKLSWKSVEWEPSCFMQTYRRTDMTKQIVAFCNYSKAPKKCFREVKSFLP